MPEFTRRHQRQIDNMSPPEPAEPGLEETLANAGTPMWLADAVCQAFYYGDTKYLDRQITKHTGFEP